MPFIGTGVSVTSNNRAMSVKPGSQDAAGTDPYNDGRFEFKDSDGKNFIVLRTGLSSAQLRVR